jgi:hypothetical protein
VGEDDAIYVLLYRGPLPSQAPPGAHGPSLFPRPLRRLVGWGAPPGGRDRPASARCRSPRGAPLPVGGAKLDRPVVLFARSGHVDEIADAFSDMILRGVLVEPREVPQGRASRRSGRSSRERRSHGPRAGMVGGESVPRSCVPHLIRLGGGKRAPSARELLTSGRPTAPWWERPGSARRPRGRRAAPMAEASPPWLDEAMGAARLDARQPRGGPDPLGRVPVSPPPSGS